MKIRDNAKATTKWTLLFDNGEYTRYKNCPAANQAELPPLKKTGAQRYQAWLFLYRVAARLDMAQRDFLMHKVPKNKKTK